MKVVLLHDASALEGRPDERDALVQVECIGVALTARGHQTMALGCGLDLEAARRALEAAAPDLVFNLVESIAGEGRLIHLATALLDSLGVPYTGAPTEAMFLGSHKVWSKRLLAQWGLPTPPWVEEDGTSGGDPIFPGRYIVKSVWEDASVGLDDRSVVDVADRTSLGEEIAARRAALGGVAFAEAWVEGREFNVAVLETREGLRVLPVAEMCFEDFPVGKPRLVGYRAKWDEDSFEYTHTVRRFDLPPDDRALVEELGAIARACCARFGLRGYARVDFRVDEAGRPWVLEVNPNPCLSPDAGYMAAAERAGLSLAAVVEAIVHSASTSAARGS